MVEGGEDPDKIRELVERAWRACMAMQTVVNAPPQETHVHVNGDRVD